MEGSYRGPLKPAHPRAGSRDHNRLRDRDMLLDQSLCTSDRGYNWAFIQCPAGTHCQSCMPGYYGDPINGGKCNEPVVASRALEQTTGSEKQKVRRGVWSENTVGRSCGVISHGS
ncbi:hypothetical protein INR49_007591 [Caranx melampygus]|nr:hypothetical protein INR49_007591 [Caranx melampygus]